MGTPHGGTGLPSEELINHATFSQLVEMDGDDDENFSRDIVHNYISQATSTFTQMENALVERNLVNLSQLGHFLKGSSGAIGVRQVQSSCEKIQNFGERKNERGEPVSETDDQLLERIRTTLAEVRTENDTATQALLHYYGEA